ncbi:MAG: HD-GYP domain-containing protein [Gemmatimonadales bacterium]
MCFATLGFFAQALGHKIGNGAEGDISFLPFLTIALLSPSMTAVATVAVAVAVTQVSVRRDPLKGVFNVAQYVMSVSVGIIVYRLLSGTSFLAYPVSFAAIAAEPLRLLVPCVALVTVFLAVNNFAVSGAIAVSGGRSFWTTWRENTLHNIVYDVLALPFVLMFVGAYSVWGPVGAILLAAPMLAVRQLYKTNWQLQRTNQELLQLMVAAIEARDPYTSGHSRRVSRYARIIATALGLSKKQIDRVTTAALLHDVGKIHENFAPILQKPGKLTLEERRIMETHSQKSADLVSHVSHLQDLVLPVLHHHENWDGTGYPQGLAAEAIPLESRIIMIAVTVDAMTSDRPYRKALGEAEVRKEIMKFRGQQFDPKMCDVLLVSPHFSRIFCSVEPAQDLLTTPARVRPGLRLGKVSA